MLIKKRASPKSHGILVTTSCRLAVITSILPLIKVSPIQAIPKMAITACIPALNTDPFVALIPSVLVARRMMAAVLSMMISIASGIPSFTVVPSMTKSGLRAGMEPKRTIATTDTRKRITLRRALKGVFALGSIVERREGSINPSLMRRRYSGSSSSSLPLWRQVSAPTNTPSNVAGILTLRMSIKLMPAGARRARSATVAAEIGLAVIACCEAMTEIERGRSGRTFVSRATSEITGRRE